MSEEYASLGPLLREKHLEVGMIASRKNSSRYSFIMILIFMLGNLASNCSVSAIPILFYENTYLCKNTKSEFTIRCKKSFVCNHKINQDYILDISKSRKSFISDYDIYCSKTKIYWLN